MKRIPALDGLRGCAALLVLWGHFPFVQGLLPVKNMAYVIGSGYLGVDIFFVLSGFLITRILLREKAEGRMSFRNFYLKRALRIFPIYYLTILLAGFFITWHGMGWLAAYLGNYYFASDLSAHPLRHTWSLAVEEHFYLVWPLLLSLLPRANARVLIRYVLPAAAIVGAVITCNLLDLGHAENLIYRGTNYRMLSLCLGASLAFDEERARSLPRWVICLLLLAVPPLAVIAAHGCTFHIGDILISDFTMKMVLYALASLCSVLIAINVDRVLPPLGTLLSNGVMRFFGRISYGLYLYHYPLLFVFGLTAEDIVIGPLKAIAMAALLVAVPTLSWYIIEAPLLRWKDRLIGHPA